MVLSTINNKIEFWEHKTRVFHFNVFSTIKQIIAYQIVFVGPAPSCTLFYQRRHFTRGQSGRAAPTFKTSISKQYLRSYSL
jgi:hypothetical protein